MNVIWSRRAASDLAQIYAYIAADSEEPALGVANRLYEAGQSLEQFPERGRPGRLTGTRELIVEPYILSYRVRRGGVHILTVEHGYRRR